MPGFMRLMSCTAHLSLQTSDYLFYNSQNGYRLPMGEHIFVHNTIKSFTSIECGQNNQITSIIMKTYINTIQLYIHSTNNY